MDIEISKITWDEERQRQDLGEEEILELMESFRNNGQIVPIVVSSTLHLIAGRRRIEAAKRLNWEKIRADIWEELDPLKKKIIEFDENDKRKQLTWQEAAKAIAEIHTLQQKEKPQWTASDTARTLGVSIGKVSEDLVLASALSNERVARRPSRRGALDTVKRERELDLVRELARRRATSLGIKDDFKSAQTTSGVVYREDCRAVLDSLEANSIDLIITDPPWGIDFDKATQWSKKWIASYDDSPNAVRTMLCDVFIKLFRVLKPTCHLYTFYPIQESEWWINALTSRGFIVRQRPLIWFKTGQPAISEVYTSFLPSYESILWAYKPGEGDVRRLFSRPIPEAFGAPRQPGLWHENEKPTEILERLLESSSEPNEIILDPFAGGASTLAASFSLGRYYIGIESDEVNWKKACERMKVLEDRKEEETSNENDS